MASKGISTLAKPRWISAAPIAGTDVIIKITDRKRHGRVEYVVRAGKPLPGGRLALVGKDKVFATKPEADAWFSHLLKQTMQDDSFGGIVSHTGADKTIEADDVAWDDAAHTAPAALPQEQQAGDERTKEQGV